MKRLFDVIASGLGLLILSPLLIVLYIAVRATSKGPGFYVQERVGRDFKPFRLIKFRSMHVHDGRGPLITAANDSRITPLGRYLRRAKLDEVPQLWNVFKGDMSLVGPRPEVARYLDTPLASEILLLRPGITDWASLVFLNEEEILAASYDRERTYREIILPQKQEIQSLYVRNRNLSVDSQILFWTFCSVLGTSWRKDSLAAYQRWRKSLKNKTASSREKTVEKGHERQSA